MVPKKKNYGGRKKQSRQLCLDLESPGLKHFKKSSPMDNPVVSDFEKETKDKGRRWSDPGQFKTSKVSSWKFEAAETSRKTPGKETQTGGRGGDRRRENSRRKVFVNSRSRGLLNQKHKRKNALDREERRERKTGRYVSSRKHVANEKGEQEGE